MERSGAERLGAERRIMKRFGAERRVWEQSEAFGSGVEDNGLECSISEPSRG